MAPDAQAMKGELKKIDKFSIIDEVVKRISDLVRSGGYSTGDRLPTEEAIRKELGVGRSTVREALRVLQAYGVVELRSGRGAFVRDKGDYTYKMVREWFMEKESELHELFEVRLAIEGAAIPLAIERGTRKQLDEIRKIHDRFRASVEAKNNIELASLDEAFHRAIVDAANNRYLSRINGLVSDALMEYRKRSFAVEANVINALGPHQTILECICAKDARAGVSALRHHIDVSLSDIHLVLEADG